MDTKELVRIAGKNIKVKFRASGHKSSEGDGRIAADIERELKENNGSKLNRA